MTEKSEARSTPESVTATEGSTTRTEANAGTFLRAALSEHDAVNPLTPQEMLTLSSEMEDALIASESQFSHPDWRYVDGLRALASALEPTADFRPPTDSVPLSGLSELLDIITGQIPDMSQPVVWLNPNAVADARASIESFVTALIEENKRLKASSPSGGDTDMDSDFWATVARDNHGFVRTQDEWDTLAAYARDKAAESELFQQRLHDAIQEADIAFQDSPQGKELIALRAKLRSLGTLE